MIRGLGMALSAAALAGCSLAPPYRQTALPVPLGWPSGDAYLAQSLAPLPRYDYRQVFADPRLLTLIEEALANNQDVAHAVANIAAARARYRIQRADRLPQLDASLGARRSDGGSSPGNAGTGNPSGGSARSSFTADLAVTGYEIDLFGRARSLTDAARDRYLASDSAAQAVRLALVADVADAWLNHAADQSLLGVAKDTVATQGKVVELTRKRLDGGIAPRTDLRQAELTLHTAEADVAVQTTAIAQDVNALQLLVGAPIDPALLAASISDASARLADIPAGLDSTVLLRRPDVVEAEYNLRAANGDIGAARADLFPRISLTGLFGFASDALGALFTGGAFNWSGAADLAYPIFRAGAGKANVALSEAQRDALLATYRKAIQTAFRDVADALARRGTIDAQIAALAANQTAAADNAHLAELRFRGGIDSYLTSLTAQQALYSTRRALVAGQFVRATNRADIYRAVGADAALATRPTR
ncbi:efflux transporter outer membrane subunit [Novosphingobium sp. Gsoil 351]|uniref:efflux transporter outer membrane subunit n=1 Tax=Novosphingobium sp. Gsoil 351 TaxID=2675225 RepID=UPI0012B4AAD7|nr:efflux transporter outer membrane subunit [Novosphingobium sp. Gsoil 351]QGN55902.1 efflux transporter outer membrane subunit [Novosphingobium sp. Gsoil 351]